MGFLIWGCSSAQKSSSEPLEGSEGSGEALKVSGGHPGRNSVNDLMVLIEKEDYRAAADWAKDFQRNHPASSETPTVIFYQGRSEFELGRYDDAAESFRKTIGLSNSARTLEAQSLYHLALSYEALGDDSRAIAALLDAKKRGTLLPEEVYRVEIPARMSSAYARLGNKEEAQRFYLEAEENLIKLRTKFEGADVPEWYAKTLYQMGRLALNENTMTDFASAMRPVKRAQVWLLKAAEQGNSKWSKKASEDLIQALKTIKGRIDKESPDPDIDDKDVAEKEYQERKTEMANILWQQLQEIKTQRLEGAENLWVNDVMSTVDGMESELQKVIEEPPVGNLLTEEAKKRRALTRPGKIVDEKGLLEKGKND